MRKNVLFYLIAFALLLPSIFFFNKTYREMLRYEELGARANKVYSCFQDLSKQINEAAVLNPDLVAASRSSRAVRLFFTDSLRVMQQLYLLDATVRDSVNIRISKNLDTVVAAELSWILASNVPDSIRQHRSPKHIEALLRIDSLINLGTRRTVFLIDFRRHKLEDALDRFKIWMACMVLLSVLLLAYSGAGFQRERMLRKTKELELEKTEGRLRSTLDNMLEGAQLHDFDWKYIYVNEALVKYSQYSKEELLGHTLMEKYPGVETTPLFATMQHCMKERVADHIQTEFVFPNGSKAFFDLSIQPVPEGLFILSVDKTEQHDAEEKLEKSTKHFRALIENGSDMIILSDVKGQIIYGSPSLGKQMGYNSDEISLLRAGSFIHPEHQGKFAANRETILQTPGASFYQQLKLLRKDGTWTWCEGTMINLLHDPGIHALVTNFRNITDKKEAEEQLEFDHSNLDALINNTEDLMWSIDSERCLITCNQPFFEMVKIISGQEIRKGQPVLQDGFPEEILRRYDSYHERAMKGEIFSETEYTNVPVELWSEISFHPIRQDGEVIGTACHSRNITKMKLAEHQLRKSEAFNRGVLNSLSSHIAVVNKSGTIVAVNESWKRFALENGVTHLQGTDVGSNYYNVCEKSLLEGISEAGEALLGMKEVMEEKRRVFYLEYPCHSPKTKRWFGMRIMKFDDDEQLIVVTHQDITARRLYELEREKMLVDITQRSKNLEQFTYAISHNLRAPVANIMGIATILKNEISEDDRKQTQTFLFEAASQLDNVIKDLVKLLQSKSEIIVNKEPVQLQLLTDLVTASIQHLVDKENVQIITDFSEATEVRTLKSYLHSVFYNLILNSIKYRKPGEAPVIRIKSSIEGDKIKISFHDNGSGIDLEKHGEKIFGLYRRFHTDIEGKGIGLFMVKTQLEDLGGTIHVKSKPGEGTEFIVLLPLE